MRHHAACLLILAAICLSAHGPLARLPDDRVLGGWSDENRDSYAFLWNAWWLGQPSQPGWPLHTELMFAPMGLDLRHHSLSLLPSALAAMLAWPLGLVRGFNLSLLLMGWLAGVSAYWLSWRLIGSRTASLATGLVFLLAPARLIQATAHPNIAAAGFLPLGILALVQAARRPDARRLPLAALALVAAALCSWYHLLPLIAFSLLGAIGCLVWRRRQGLGSAIGLLGPWLPAALVLMPLAWPLWRRPALSSGGDAARFSARLWDLLWPHSLHPLRQLGWLAAPPPTPGNQIEASLYLGWVTLTLAGNRLILGVEKIVWIFVRKEVLGYRTDIELENACAAFCPNFYEPRTG